MSSRFQAPRPKLVAQPPRPVLEDVRPAVSAPAATTNAVSPAPQAFGDHFAGITIVPEDARTAPIPVQRDGADLPPVPDVHLTPPSLLAPPNLPPLLDSSLHLEIDPAFAQTMEHLDQQLNPGNVRAALANLRLGALPPLGGTAPPPASLPPAGGGAPPPIVPAAAGPATAQAADAGDLMDAVLAVPAIDRAITDVRTQSVAVVRRDWTRLGAGEKVGFVSTVAVIGLGSIGGAWSQPELRQLLLSQLNGRVLQVPGMDWLHVEVNVAQDNLMFGVHIDVGALLPSSLGFSSGPPKTIGGVPQPQPSPYLQGQRAATPDADTAPPPGEGDLAQRITAAGGGLPIAETPRRYLEAGLRADLSSVRVHADGEADALARAMQARAFTTGPHIFFRQGTYDPTSNTGMRLLAHEATHTVQQQAGPVAGTPILGGVAISTPGDPFEQAAERAATTLAPHPHGHSFAAIGVMPTSRPALSGVPDGIPTIQRDPTPNASFQPPPMSSVAPVQTPANAAPLSPEAQQQLLYATTTLRRVQPLGEGDRATLEKVIPGAPVFSQIKERDAKRSLLAEKTTALEQMKKDLAGPPPEHGALASPEVIKALTAEIAALPAEIEQLNTAIQAGLGPLHVANEAELVAMVTERFPKLFVERAKLIAKTELDQNQQIVDREATRYGVNASIDPAERNALRAAARDLVSRQTKIGDLDRRLDAANQRLHGGAPVPSQTPPSDPEVDHLQRERDTATAEREQQRTTYGLQHPILLRGDIDLAVLGNGNDSQVSELIGGKITEITDNIKDTKGNIDSGRLKIWDLHNIVEMTSQDLGVTGNTVLQGALQSHFAKEKSDEQMVKIGIAALAITAGVIATVASGGVALAAGGVAVAAGGYQASQSVQSYLAESSASNVAIDPRVQDISKNEPELFWLVLDIAGVVLDAAQVVKVFNQLRTAAQALKATGEIEAFAKAARQAIPGEGAERVIASATRQGGVSKNIGEVVKAVGAAFRKADLVAVGKRLESLADEGFHAVYLNLETQGRVLPLTKEGLEGVYGAERAAQIVEEGMLKHSGLFKDGRLFIQPGHLDSVTSSVVHESTHYMQEMHGVNLFDKEAQWMAEFEAVAAERRYVDRLVAESSVKGVPDDLLWLVGASDEKLTAHVVEHYPHLTRPTVVDGEQAVRDMLARGQGL